MTPLIPQGKPLMTPESSPFAKRTSSSPALLDFSTAKTPPPLPSQLSSPFAAKATVPSRQPTLVDDFFASSILTKPITNMSTPPISPPPATGGELERLHQTMMQEKLSHIQELETRRPDYLKRMKRPLTDTDDDVAEIGPVGITETPIKGRRLKLFQETSEESFEESLMAGGYGRYRTAEWVRQPQPLLLGQPSAPVMAMLEEQQQQPPPKEPTPPPSERELKKRKRLAAFRSEGAPVSSRLFPVELEGKGRVLLDIPNDALMLETTPKKRANAANASGSTRRRRKADSPPKEPTETALPDWPDSEFPWRLRTEERTELAKAEETERLKWISNFLDRESDEEDDGEGGLIPGPVVDEDVIPSAKWGLIYEDDSDRPMPSRRGRGKMVPLQGDPSHYARRKSAYFPSDPADARAALLSKRSVRALSYRRQRISRTEEEVLCICRGTDDGRELVQCDGCKTWYHLQCLGIRSVSELGREEDPWFCHHCVPGSQSESEPEHQEIYFAEPTFVPTDETPRIRRAYDGTFLEGSVPDSPAPNWGSTRMPKTPTREPTTPRQPGVRVYSTPGLHDGLRLSDDYDDFDPTSTPSRGITFNAPFTTPKNNMWARGAPQTPSKPAARGSKSFGGPGFLSAMLDHTSPSYESPYRPNKTPQARRILDPSRPLPPRFEIPILDGSPRPKGKERMQDST